MTEPQRASGGALKSILIDAGMPRLMGYGAISVLLSISCIMANAVVYRSIELGEPAASPDVRLGTFYGNDILAEAVLVLFFFATFVAADRFVLKLDRSANVNRGSRDVPRFSKWLLLVIMTIGLFAAWSPYMVMLYPGVYYDDTAFQLAQYLGADNLSVYSGAPDVNASKITDHHPVITTLLYGGFAQMGGLLLGAEYRGLFVLGVIQALFLASSISASLLYARRVLMTPVWVLVGFLVVCALNPTMGIIAFSIVEDSLFAPVFVFFVLLYIELMRTDGLLLKRRGYLIAFAVVALWMILVKKIAIYLLVVCLLFAAMRCRNCRMRIISVAFGGIVVLFVIFPLVLFPSIGASAGSYRESLSVPFQQTAWLVHECEPALHDEMSEDELRVIDDMLDLSTLEGRCYLTTADFVKNLAPLAGSRIDYAVLYLKQGIRYPASYAKTWFRLNSGFFAPTDVFYPRIASVHNQYLDELCGRMGLDLYPEAAPNSDDEKRIKHIIDVIASVPIVGLLETKALWALLLPIAILSLMLFRRRQMVLATAPYFLFVAFLFLGPLSTNCGSARYVFPLVCVTPIIVCCLFGQNYHSVAYQKDKEERFCSASIIKKPNRKLGSNRK